MRDDGRDACLRVLGLTPGASAQEIKAAYRDLAKVWHPDRFAHDPRLQQKAQEQLKEINEAHQRLVSGDFAKPNAQPRRDTRSAYDARPPRAADAPPRAPRPAAAHDRSQEAHAATTADERVATRPRRRVNRLALAAPALAFCATFALVTPGLLNSVRAPEQSEEAAADSAPAEHAGPARQPADAVTATSDAVTKAPRDQQKATVASQQHTTAGEAAGDAARPVRALPTVTLSIDPTTGLRARAACPHKTAMTFPAGDEPGGYCDAHAAAPPGAAPGGESAGKRDGSRAKSFANRVAAPAKKLFGEIH